jgi:hypothetical protein
MNAISGEPWSELDLWELKTSMKYRRSFAEVAGFLFRDEEEVRDMAKALGLKESVSIGSAALTPPSPAINGAPAHRPRWVSR